MNGSKLDNQSAIFLAAVCGQTYNQFASLQQSFLVPYGYQVVGSFQASAFSINEQPFGFVIESERAAILAFRGTSTATDWVTDMMAQQITFTPVKNSGLTHRGFTEIYMSARDRVFKLLDKLPNNKPLFITGHSLGGALAILATLDITVNRNFNQIITYTYGSPRVGDPAFVQYYNASVPTSIRVQNEYDIVPHLPPLVFKAPKTDKTFYYMHVKAEEKRSFRNGSIGGNHIISSYFADLARESPIFAETICSQPLGWCPELQ
ncbi:lipase [Paenibacillus baekrokdamisoli]|uniref:Lipase n=1 Tax=Paenibacillus baekrokdamisoli TaxID=1712516 RepID=A0A3G9J1G0_9BACL|nr:lipase family protein [Paenibacillus baekrokdamisoli]MBB3070857.1 triacylglycerol lipase [Paenibacillus baekrokdamisoli]BBH22205.1 lipase [Paenibacillus baekrokdamisoli]